MLQKEESNYDETSIRCSKRVAFIGIYFSLLPSIPSFGEQTLKESYRMHIFKKKRLNLWLCLPYSNERFACNVLTMEAIEIFQNSKM